MRKKFTHSICILLAIITSLFVFVSCGNENNLKKVDIDGYGSIKVPKEWQVSVIDGFMYFSLNEKDVFVPYQNDVFYNTYSLEIKQMTWLEGEVFSNSAHITKYRVRYKDDSTKELFVLSFTSPDVIGRHIEFICIDDSIPEDTLVKIAKSYEMYW